MFAEVVGDLSVMQPYVQWGFAGFCFVVFASLTSVIVWLIKNLLAVLKESNKVISGNTEAISATTVKSESIERKIDNVSEKIDGLEGRILARPCLMRPDVAFRTDKTSE